MVLLLLFFFPLFGMSCTEGCNSWTDGCQSSLFRISTCPHAKSMWTPDNHTHNNVLVEHFIPVFVTLCCYNILLGRFSTQFWSMSVAHSTTWALVSSGTDFRWRGLGFSHCSRQSQRFSATEILHKTSLNLTLLTWHDWINLGPVV